jgi:hypothetical protein
MTPVQIGPVLATSVREGMARIADLVLPGTQLQPRGRDVGAHAELLDLVLAADPTLVEAVSDFGRRAAVTGQLALTDLQGWSEVDCERVVFALTAAYYMSPAVRAAIGYPGQGRRPISAATPDEQCSDELIQPVVDRGEVFVPAE